MKSTFTTLLLLFNCIAYCQLNNVSTTIMSSSPETFQSIRLLSIKKHGVSNNQLLSSEINDQCMAFTNILKAKNIDNELLITAMFKNTYQKDRFLELLELRKITETFSLVIDWVRTVKYYNENIGFTR